MLLHILGPRDMNVELSNFISHIDTDGVEQSCFV